MKVSTLLVRSIPLAGALILSSCAKSPESIAPAYVSPLIYQDYSCNQLAEESARVERALAQTSEQQRNARSNDTLGVIFLGLPVSTLSGGNVADQVAQLKGEQESLQTTVIKKNCTSKAGARQSLNEPKSEPVATAYTALPSGITAPYEGVKLSNYSASDMRWFCGQKWETRTSPTGRTEFNPCHRPGVFTE